MCDSKKMLIRTLYAILLVTLTTVEGRLHLGKTQINLVFRSICTTFAH